MKRMNNSSYDYNKIRNLFLSQTYQDSWDDYEKSLKKFRSLYWDYVFITASNESQAENYRIQIDNRLQMGVLTESARYIVIPDPDGIRVGSGGATLNVIRHLAEDIVGNNVQVPENDNIFIGKRILVIHSGGDSKRIPQYSAIGKLFSPVPRLLPDGRPSTLFDELIIATASIPSRISDGMLVMSGDALLLMNTLQIDIQMTGAAALSIKEPVSSGKNHGVFLGDNNGLVKRFLHKQSEETLRCQGAVDDRGAVNLDTGAILIGNDLLNALWGLISEDNNLDLEAFNTFVNDKARVSFYGDFLYPLATDSTLEQFYGEKPEGEYTEELRYCRQKIWESIAHFDLKLIPLSPARFIHFGTTRELRELMTEDINDYAYLGWSRRIMSYCEGINFSSYSSYIGHGVRIGNGSYIENSYILGKSVIGKGCIISNIKLCDVSVPDGIVLHGLPLQNGRFVCRAYNVMDNPKDIIIGDTVLWDAKLFPICDSMEKAVEWALWLHNTGYSNITSDERTEWYRWQDCMSLNSSYNQADVKALLQWQKELRERVLASLFIDAITEDKYVEDALTIFDGEGMTQDVFDMLMCDASSTEYSVAMRIYYGISRYMKRADVKYEYRDTLVDYDYMEKLAFQSIRDVFTTKDSSEGDVSNKLSIVKDSADVKLPVRVNFGGGWTDTPPYCLEHGGTVLNAAITLNGEYPIQVHIKKLNTYHIEFESQDVGVHQIFRDIDSIMDCNNPYDVFALHKAAIIACGIIPIGDENILEEVLEGLGGGIYLSTQAYGVPKGSGLGTSSILSAACVKAISEFFDFKWSIERISSTVMHMEQLMSTGGGWQDQIGGLIPGFKLITSEPSIKQELNIETLNIPEVSLKELNERLALIYTGQRRLARNLLREVCGGYIGGRPESIEALKGMKELTYSMADALKEGDIDSFANLMERHWNLSCMLDKGTTNNCINHIFVSCEDMIDARFIAGAGGGGFVMVVLKKGITKQDLSERISAIYQDSGVNVWDYEFSL